MEIPRPESSQPTIEQLIAADRLEEAQIKLAAFANYCAGEIKESLTQNQARLASLKRQLETHALSGNDAGIERNRIRLALLEALEQFRRQQLSPLFGFADRNQLFDSITSRDTVVHEILSHRLLPKRYRLELPALTEGNSAIIFRVENLDTARHAVVLVIKAPTLDEPVRQEIKRLTDLRHRNVVKILDHNLEKFPYFILSEFVYGPNLPKALEGDSHRPIAQATDWLYQLTEALDYLRHKRILHTNVRPSKIYIDDEWQLMISPVDLFKLSSYENTYNRYRDVCQYGSPELMANDGAALCVPGKKPDESDAIDMHAMCVSDQYSIGLIGYKLLTGKDLFEGESIAGILQSRQKFSSNTVYRREKLKALPKSKISDIIRRLLSESPAGRYSDLHTLIRILHGITRTDQAPVSLLRQSYRRCMGLNRELIRDFYQTFHALSNQAHRPDFSPIGEKKQYVMLQMAIDVLIDIDKQSEKFLQIIRNTKHQKYGATDFEVFLEAFMRTIADNDPQWELVADDWGHMREKALQIIAQERTA